MDFIPFSCYTGINFPRVENDCWGVWGRPMTTSSFYTVGASEGKMHGVAGGQVRLGQVEDFRSWSWIAGVFAASSCPVLAN